MKCVDNIQITFENEIIIIFTDAFGASRRSRKSVAAL